MSDVTAPAPTTAPNSATLQPPAPSANGHRLPRPRRATRGRWPRRERWALTGLLTLSAVPVLAGAVRVGELASDPVVTDANARFVTDPAPVVVHIITATIFTVLGAFQLMPTNRRRHLRRHRMMGRVVAPAGVVAALSGVWMTLFYASPPSDGVSLAVVRIAVGLAMALFLVLGVVAAVRRDIPTHRAWVMRGYAIGLGAGTQVLTSGPLLLMDGPPSELLRTSTMTLGWLVNAVVAELIIRRGRGTRRASRPRAPEKIAAVPGPRSEWNGRARAGVGARGFLDPHVGRRSPSSATRPAGRP